MDLTTKLLVGVSGGPDSMYLLNELVKKGYQKIIVCHVNYHFRIDSDHDEEIVKTYCLEHHIPFYLKEVKDNDYANNRINFEGWARKIRYDFFQEVADREKTRYLLIAHNLNDLIETFIIQKQRKNLVSYYGLKKVTNFNELIIIRPLLDLRKDEILKRVEKEKISFAIDSTNFDLHYQRNQIRGKLKVENFSGYLEEIKQLNLVNEKEKNEAIFYVKNNLKDQNLCLLPSFFSLETEVIMFILLEYFKEVKQDKLFLNRKNNSLRALALQLKNSQKNYFSFQIANHFIIKDFNELYLVDQSWFEVQNYYVETEEDLEKLKDLRDYQAIRITIKNDRDSFPYWITNDFQSYKTKTYSQNQKTNRYFINQKIPYKNRFIILAIIRIKDNQLVNYKIF